MRRKRLAKQKGARNGAQAWIHEWREGADANFNDVGQTAARKRDQIDSLFVQPRSSSAT